MKQKDTGRLRSWQRSSTSGISPKNRKILGDKLNLFLSQRFLYMLLSEDKNVFDQQNEDILLVLTALNPV